MVEQSNGEKIFITMTRVGLIVCFNYFKQVNKSDLGKGYSINILQACKQV
jgi:hypothetical protein